MNLTNWILDPLSQYATLAISLALSLYLFFSVKRENHALKRRLDAERSAYQSVLGSLRSTLNRLEEEMVSHAADRIVGSTLTPPHSVNRTTRSQALRLHRHGESAEAIAAALQLPRKEVELLLKVHSSVLQQA